MYSRRIMRAISFVLAVIMLMWSISAVPTGGESRSVLIAPVAPPLVFTQPAQST